MEWQPRQYILRFSRQHHHNNVVCAGAALIFFSSTYTLTVAQNVLVSVFHILSTLPRRVGAGGAREHGPARGPIPETWQCATSERSLRQRYRTVGSDP